MPRKFARGQKLVLASHNKGKLREIEALLHPLGIEVVSAGDLGLPEPEENAPDFAGNARIKALAAATASGLPGAVRRFRLLCRRAGRRARRSLRALGGAGQGFCRTPWPRCRNASAPTPTAAPGSSPRCASPGLTGTPKRSSVALTAPSSGRPAATRVSATIRCSSPPAPNARSARWIQTEKHAVSHRARAFAQVLTSCFG